MDGAPLWSEDQIWAVTVYRPLRRVVAGGRRSSVAERQQLKPVALGSTPGNATFLSRPLPFQRSTDSDILDLVFKP